MNLLPQILKNSSKNLLVNHFVDSFKKKIDHFLEHFMYGNVTHPYPSFFLEMQQIMNQFCIDFTTKYYELIDKDFRDSEQRKKNYVINKSNVPRTLITIFETITFYRTLYQKINRSTLDKELRQKIADIIYKNEDKKTFIKEMDKLIESKEKESRKQKITEYKNYILKNWKGIINMKNSLCKSSMESHIQHCMASAFSSVPKGYSRKNIENYIKLQEMFLNGVSIFEYYMDTYNSDENYEFNNEKEVNYSIFESSTSTMPILNSSSNVSHALHNFIY